MRMHTALLVCALAAACGGKKKSPASPVPAPKAASPTGQLSLVMASADAQGDDVIAMRQNRPGGVNPGWGKGVLEIDGQPTAIPWTGHRPAAFKLADGRFIIDTYNQRLYLWQPVGQTVTALGLGSVVRAGTAGSLIERTRRSAGHVRTEYFDIHPTGDALRSIWPPAGAAPKGHGSVIGSHNGAPVIATQSVTYRQGSLTLGRTIEFATVYGPGDYRRRTWNVPAQSAPVGRDSIRGDRVLLVRRNHKAGGRPNRRPEGRVFVLDLSTGTFRDRGAVRGGFTVTTAMSHPWLDVRWSNARPANPEVDCTVSIDPTSEQPSPCPRLIRNATNAPTP